MKHFIYEGACGVMHVKVFNKNDDWAIDKWLWIITVTVYH